MPTAWRIVKAKHAATAFDGESARRFGGRWNSPGTAVVYCSESLALAALELLVHLESSEVLEAYVAFRVEFPESVVRAIDEAWLPPNWREYPPPPAVQELGDAWALAEDSAVLRVPSILVEGEHNYVFDPHHPDFSEIEVRGLAEERMSSRVRIGRPHRVA